MRASVDVDQAGSIDKRWLPTGAHTDLNIERAPGLSAGAFTGGGWKLCWHITVSPFMAVDAMVSVLKNKRAEPHLVIGGRPGFKFPVVVQLLPFDQAGRALANDASDGAQTNRANVIQVEICATPGNLRGLLSSPGDGTGLFELPGFHVPEDALLAAQNAANGLELCMTHTKGDAAARQFNSGVAAWTDDTYRALANLGLWIENRVPIPRRCARTFKNTTRFSDAGFVKASGHLGHMHVPDNNHFDPTTDFKGKHLIALMNSGPHDL